MLFFPKKFILFFLLLSFVELRDVKRKALQAPTYITTQSKKNPTKTNNKPRPNPKLKIDREILKVFVVYFQSLHMLNCFRPRELNF